VREKGLLHIRGVHLGALYDAARSCAVPGAADGEPAAVEALLRSAVAALGGGRLGEAAEYTFGLVPGTRDWPQQRRRQECARIYEVGTDRFRKHYEKLLVQQVAEKITWLCQQAAAKARDPATASQPGDGPGDAHQEPNLKPLARTTQVDVPTGNGALAPVTVHSGSVELLTDIDVLVSPTNTYFEVASIFKSSVSASLRRAAAVKNETGEIIDDVVARGLNSWIVKHARPGLPVAAGTVVPTEAGELSSRGIRRIYHAAVVSPKHGTNEYSTSPDVIARATVNILRLARQESAGSASPLRSVCFPLLGAGRGGMDPSVSLAWIWDALSQDLARDMSWEIHFVTRQPRLAEFVVTMLSAAAPRGQADGGHPPSARR
jgi:O-acetyl-ADP-ribose deacetylase (regulator of RNase III)